MYKMFTVLICQIVFHLFHNINILIAAKLEAATMDGRLGWDDEIFDYWRIFGMKIDYTICYDMFLHMWILVLFQQLGIPEGYSHRYWRFLAVPLFPCCVLPHIMALTTGKSKIARCSIESPSWIELVLTNKSIRDVSRHFTTYVT